MKKVLCQSCGLMNLEKFVTFPNCAGCGVRLPVHAQESFLERWKRPLRAPLWAAVVGICCLGLAYWSITIARETGRSQEKQVIAYVQYARKVDLKKTVRVQLLLDTTEGDSSAAIPQFQNVRIRFAKATFDDFTLVSISPQATLSESGSSKYYGFNSVARNQMIYIDLRPRRTGKGRVALSLFVKDFSPFHYQGTMKITRAQSAKVADSRQNPKLAQ